MYVGAQSIDYKTDLFQIVSELRIKHQLFLNLDYFNNQLNILNDIKINVQIHKKTNKL